MQLNGYDEVWLVPSGDRTDKTMSLPHADRLALLKIVCDTFASHTRPLRLIQDELLRTVPTETYDTYKAFIARHPTIKFWFVFGTDSYATIRQWYNGDYLAEHLPVLLIERAAKVPSPSKHVRFLRPLPAPLCHISSTQVREALTQSRPYTHLVSPEVATYLELHHLFKP